MNGEHIGAGVMHTAYKTLHLHCAQRTVTDDHTSHLLQFLDMSTDSLSTIFCEIVSCNPTEVCQ